MAMKQKVFTTIEILFESLYFLVITYTLSSMAISFNHDLYGLLCRIANIYAITRYYTSIKKLTGSTLWTYILLAAVLLLFSAIAWRCGYVSGAFTPFAHR